MICVWQTSEDASRQMTGCVWDPSATERIERQEKYLSYKVALPLFIMSKMELHISRFSTVKLNKKHENIKPFFHYFVFSYRQNIDAS